MTNIDAAHSIAHALAVAGFPIGDVASAVVDPDVYPELDATSLAGIIVADDVDPSIDRAGLNTALRATSRYVDAAITAALDAYRPTTAPPTPPMTGGAFALVGGAFLSAASHPAYDFGASPFTVEAMVRTTTPGTLVARKGTEGGPNNGGFLVVVQPDGSVKFATDDGFGFTQGIFGGVVTDGQWHHVAAVGGGTRLAVYVDGTPRTGVGSGTRPMPLVVDNTQPLTIGTTMQVQEPYRSLTGAIAQVRLWNRALSSAEIQAGLGQPVPATTEGLVGSWTGVDAQPVDASPIGNPTSAFGSVTATDGPPLGGPAIAWPGPVFPEPSYPMTPVVATTNAEWASRLFGLDGWDLRPPTQGGSLDVATGAVQSGGDSSTLLAVTAMGASGAVDVVSYVCVGGAGAADVDVAVYPASTAGATKYQGWNGTAFADGPAIPIAGHYWYRLSLRWAPPFEDPTSVFYAKTYRTHTPQPFTLWAYQGSPPS